MPYILQTNHLTKTIGGHDLVRDVNIHVEKGEIYGFLSPNGAGKTTVMKLVTNLWKPTAGTVELFGDPLTPTSYKVLKRMGSIIESPTFYEHLTGRENLQLHCEYMGYHSPGSVDDALEMLSLTAACEKPVREYSLGMKQRLGIARALLCRPELLILDEPVNGLDPAGLKQIRDLFRRLCAEYGITIFLSGHILPEIESIADTIGIIRKGQIVQEISMKEISLTNTDYLELSTENVKKAAYVLAEKLKLTNFKVMNGQDIRIYEPALSVRELSEVMSRNNVELLSIGRRSESLENYFLKLTEEDK